MREKWPKQPEELSPELREKFEKWEADWLLHMHNAYGFVPRFNEVFLKAVASSLPPSPMLLDIGPGRTDQVRRLFREAIYHCVDRRADFCEQIRKVVPAERVFNQDAGDRLPVPDRSFDAVVAIHLLEHLRNLPITLKEIRRVLKPEGYFFAVIPCEGSPLYSLGRRFSSARRFRQKFGDGFREIMRWEHVNTAWEVVEELKKEFRLVKRRMYPFNFAPFGLWGNLLAGLQCKPIA